MKPGEGFALAAAHIWMNHKNIMRDRACFAHKGKNSEWPVTLMAHTVISYIYRWSHRVINFFFPTFSFNGTNATTAKSNSGQYTSVVKVLVCEIQWWVVLLTLARIIYCHWIWTITHFFYPSCKTFQYIYFFKPKRPAKKTFLQCINQSDDQQVQVTC